MNKRATAEVLNIIGASPSELERALEVVVKSAARLCEADDLSEPGQTWFRTARIANLDVCEVVHEPGGVPAAAASG